MRLIKQVQAVMEQREHLSNIHTYLTQLDDTLRGMQDELNEATEENALEVCKSVADRLDEFYQAL
jgi:predicted component of type VI protein secretion system